MFKNDAPPPTPSVLKIAFLGQPFTAADGQAFVRVKAIFEDRLVIHPLRSPAFRSWFCDAFFRYNNSIPSSYDY